MPYRYACLQQDLVAWVPADIPPLVAPSLALILPFEPLEDYVYNATAVKAGIKRSCVTSGIVYLTARVCLA